MIERRAAERHELHREHASSRPLSKDYELVGLAGEMALAELTGCAPDLALRPSGDGGTDARILLSYTVNIHTARKPYNLIHEVGTKTADILVLAGYSDAAQKAHMIGWEWGRFVLLAPKKDFGYGIINHFIPAKKLRPMEELRRRVFHLPTILERL